MSTPAELIGDGHRLFIGGEWAAPLGTDTIDVISPYTEEKVATVAAGSPADADRALEAARKAFDAGPWATTSPAERVTVLRRIAEGILARADDIAALITAELGVPVRSAAMGQVYGPSLVFNHFADLAESFAFAERRPGLLGSVEVQQLPVGVCVGIVPWNAPLFITAMKLGAALASGSTMVLKPAVETPLDSFLVAEVIADSGLPEGVVSILPGGADLGEYLVRHPAVDKVSFTGSSAIGRRVGASCGEQLKRCTLELGGKSAAIILDDADLDSIVPALVDAGIGNSGQVCAAQTRIVAPASRYNEVVDAFAEVMATKIVGDPTDPATDLGPLVSRRQRTRVEEYLQIGVAEGARAVIGGTRPTSPSRGWYAAPTLFADATNDMRIAREEIFGPVVTVIPYHGDEDAIRTANDSDYGLSGSVWGADAQRATAVARRIRTGTCAVNSSMVMEPTNPFGGFKGSGIGRELGPEGLSVYLETRTVVLPF